MKKDDSITFSVIIPYFNSKKTITQCVNSVLSQTNLPNEIIFIDDNSRDDTLKIIKELKEHFKKKILFKIIENNENMGPGYSRNIGWNLANSSYVAFLDSDDIWIKNKLQIQKEQIINLNFPDLIGAKCLSKKNHSTKISKITLPQLFWKNPFCTSTILIKKSVNDRFENKYYSEDFLLWSKIISKGKQAYCYNGLLSKPISRRGLSNQNFKMYLGELRVIQFLSRKTNYIFLIPGVLWVTLKFFKRAIYFES